MLQSGKQTTQSHRKTKNKENPETEVPSLRNKSLTEREWRAQERFSYVSSIKNVEKTSCTTENVDFKQFVTSHDCEKVTVP